MDSQRPPQIEPLTPRIANADIHHILSYSNPILCLSSWTCLAKWSVSFCSLDLLEHVICDFRLTGSKRCCFPPTTVICFAV